MNDARKEIAKVNGIVEIIPLVGNEAYAPIIATIAEIKIDAFVFSNNSFLNIFFTVSSSPPKIWGYYMDLYSLSVIACCRHLPICFCPLFHIRNTCGL